MTLNIIIGALVVAAIWLFNSIFILREYERAVVFRLGRLLDEAKGPGIILAWFPIDKVVRVSLRTVTMDVPTQDAQSTAAVSA